MNCPFYGKAAATLDRGMGRVDFPIVDGGVNQCGIVLGSYAPCYMEALHQQPPNASACELLAAVESRYAWERQEAARANVGAAS